MMRAVVVDDEPLARELLASMLGEIPGVEVVAAYGDGAAAVAGLAGDRPDVLFLDVRMPELDGFAVLAELAEERPPAVVFVTAYDEHALAAFEVGVVDYLLKPFDEERLERAVARARERSGDGEDLRRLRQVLGRLVGAAPAPTAPEWLVVWENERALFVPVAAIDWLEAEGKFVKIHAGPQVYTQREALSRLTDELAPRGFRRVSRSASVNVDRIREVQTWFHGDRLIVLHNGDKVPTTRGYRDVVQEILAGR